MSTAYSLTASAWQDLGAGPCLVVLNTKDSILLSASASQPVSDAVAFSVTDRFQYEGTSHLWGKADASFDGGTAGASVVVTAIAVAGGGGGTSNTTEATALLIKANIGATDEAAAATPGATGGLHALIAGFWTAYNSLTGALTETAPATDTASSGTNGRLQRIAQRTTTLISYFAPATWATFPARITLVANTASDLLAAATATKQVILYNESATDIVYVRWDGSAATTVLGYPIPPLGTFSIKSFVPTAKISGISTGTPTVRVVYV